MSAITLTPVDPTTAAVVVNSDILYHVFTINGVTRVFFSKGGKSPYQIDVQETASAIAALCPNLVEVTTVNGAEYLFIGSGGAGPGLGIMFIEADGSGSKITFRYTEESGNTLFYSLDSPSVIAGRINSPIGGQILTKQLTLTEAQILTLDSTPVELIESPGPNKIIVIDNIVLYPLGGNNADPGAQLLFGDGSGVNTWYIPTDGGGYPPLHFNFCLYRAQPVLLEGSGIFIQADQPIKVSSSQAYTTGSDTKVFLTYQIISV